MKLLLINKAINLLNAAGVEYAVELPDGTIAGKFLDGDGVPVVAAPSLQGPNVNGPAPAERPPTPPGPPTLQAEGAPQAPAAEPPKRRRAASKTRIRWEAKVMPGYREKIRQLAAGGSMEWTLPDFSSAQAFQRCVASTAHDAFGSGNFMTSVDHKTNTLTLVRN